MAADDALVLVPLPDGRALALDADVYMRALERGRELLPDEQRQQTPTAEGEVTDAHGMESRTGVPASWWLEAARRGDVPTIRCGKYVRFRVTDALGAMEVRRGG